MICDIKINPKTLECTLEFELTHFISDKEFKDSLAILTMVSGDYSLDPEIELDEFKDLINQGVSSKKSIIQFLIDEEGIEAELL
jgi:hypothetical protein